MFKHLAILTLSVLALTAFASAQKQRPSPAAQAQCKFADGKTITVDYSSPRMKGRKIFGDLVPFGEVWRTGANEATTFVTTANLTVGGKEVPAGSYTIFTVPKQDGWTLIINKKTGEWGIPYKYESDELARVAMKVSPTPSAVENFTIAFDESGKTCTLNISWENSQVSVEIAEGN
ncbi:MAG: DUF2911 domain-containing protein [Terriglobales bacterium]